MAPTRLPALVRAAGPDLRDAVFAWLLMGLALAGTQFEHVPGDFRPPTPA